MSTNIYSYHVHAPKQDSEPNPSRTKFDFFDVELNLTRLLSGGDAPVNARIVYKEMFRFSRDELLVSDPEYLHYWLLITSGDDELVRAIMADTATLANRMDGDPGNNGREAVQIIIDARVTTCYNDREDFLREYYRLMNRTPTLEPEGETETTTQFEPASESSIKSLKRLQLSESGSGTKTGDELLNNKSDSNCCICLEDFGRGDETAEMPCEHVFHGDCIVRWLETSHFCPLCRFQMPV